MDGGLVPLLACSMHPPAQRLFRCSEASPTARPKTRDVSGCPLEIFGVFGRRSERKNGAAKR